MDKRALSFNAVMKARVGAFQEAAVLFKYLYAEQADLLSGLGWAYVLTRQHHYDQAYLVLEQLQPQTHEQKQYCDRLKRRCEKALAV